MPNETVLLLQVTSPVLRRFEKAVEEIVSAMGNGWILSAYGTTIHFAAKMPALSTPHAVGWHYRRGPAPSHPKWLQISRSIQGGEEISTDKCSMGVGGLVV